MAPHGKNVAVKRLLREYRAICKDPLPHIVLKPDNDNMLVWHFVFYNLPNDSPYYKGVYHGRLDFPDDYPFSAPKIQMFTPNGRFACHVALCFSMSNYHPESWNPSWRMETILVGLLSFMLGSAIYNKTSDATDPSTTGALITSDKLKREFAKKSFIENKKQLLFRRMFPEFCDEKCYEKDIGFEYPTSASSVLNPTLFGTSEQPIQLHQVQLKTHSELSSSSFSMSLSIISSILSFNYNINKIENKYHNLDFYRIVFLLLMILPIVICFIYYVFK